MKFICNRENISADVAEIIRAFDPRALETDGGGEVRLTFTRVENSAEILLEYYESENTPKYTFEKRVNLEHFSCPEEEKRMVKREAKVMLYDLMARIYNTVLPYGSLTGVRPTKLYREVSGAGGDAYKYFTEYLRVRRDKAELVKSVCAAQEGLISGDKRDIDLFVNIPFCTTRCSYCSFISAEIGRVKKFIPGYVELLVKEIEDARRLIAEYGYFLRAVYVGGGTPTSLDDKDFLRVMGALNGVDVEFTVEAGRPDTITYDKLKIMDDMGVTRISVNPQSLNDKTIALIGRRHTAADFYAAYDMARKFSFDVNCDLIAGLPGEEAEDFARTADGIFALRPENVTVHTLALKKGSGLKLAGYDNRASDVGAMVDYARSLAGGNGYLPYYMYRQKYMSGNMENVGYCLPGRQCVYNIDVMEECASIIACGAGGISKLYVPEENRLERLADPKGIDVYLQRGDSLTEAKRAFFPCLKG